MSRRPRTDKRVETRRRLCPYLHCLFASFVPKSFVVISCVAVIWSRSNELPQDLYLQLQLWHVWACCFRPISWYSFVDPSEGEDCPILPLRPNPFLIICFVAPSTCCLFSVLKDYEGVWANLLASLSTISFPLKPLWLGIHCTCSVMTFSPLSFQL